MTRVYCKDCEWEHDEDNPIVALGVGQRHEDEHAGHTVVTSLADI